MYDSTRRSTDHVHSDQAAHSGTAQEIEDDCLGPIIGSMTGQDVDGESGVSSSASPRLDIRSGFDHHSSCLERGTHIASTPLDQIGLTLRPGTKSVIDMNRRDLESVVNGKGQEGERIGSTRYRTRNARPGVGEMTPIENR